MNVCSGVETGIPARTVRRASTLPEMGFQTLAAQPLAVFRHGDMGLVIVRHGKIPELCSCVVACIAVKTCQPQCCSGTNRRGEHNIGPYVEVVKDLLVATTD